MTDFIEAFEKKIGALEAADREMKQARRFNVACQMMAGMLANPNLASDISWDEESVVNRDGESLLVHTAFAIADKMLAKKEETRQ